MRIKIKATNIDLSESIKEYVDKKIGSLEKFTREFVADEKKLENPIESRKGRIEAFVDVGKESGGSNKGLFFSKARITIPGEKIVIARTRSADLREAIDDLKDELYSQLSTISKKEAAITEREVRKVKKKINISEDAQFNQKGRIREEGL